MAQVENTPFENGIEKTWQYVQDIGYNTNIEITYDTTEVKIYGQQSFNLKSATIIQYTIKGRFMSR